MAAAEHGGLADELVDAARSRQEIAEMMHVPGARVIVLDVGKGSALMADDHIVMRGSSRSSSSSETCPSASPHQRWTSGVSSHRRAIGMSAGVIGRKP